MLITFVCLNKKKKKKPKHTFVTTTIILSILCPVMLLYVSRWQHIASQKLQ